MPKWFARACTHAQRGGRRAGEGINHKIWRSDGAWKTVFHGGGAVATAELGSEAWRSLLSRRSRSARILGIADRERIAAGRRLHEGPCGSVTAQGFSFMLFGIGYGFIGKEPLLRCFSARRWCNET